MHTQDMAKGIIKYKFYQVDTSLVDIQSSHPRPPSSLQTQRPPPWSTSTWWSKLQAMWVVEASPEDVGQVGPGRQMCFQSLPQFVYPFEILACSIVWQCWAGE